MERNFFLAAKYKALLVTFLLYSTISNSFLITSQNVHTHSIKNGSPKLALFSSPEKNDATSFPAFVPFPEAQEIQEEKAIHVLKNIKTVFLTLPDAISEMPVRTSFAQVGKVNSQVPPLLLLHGFDSSCTEFRRLLPELEALGQEVYALDILGWGFNQYRGIHSFSAESKLVHLHSFWQSVLGSRPVALAGASLGGAVAIEFAYAYPEAVSKLVLIDAQGFIDGAGPGSSLPKPLARLGIKFLQSAFLRSLANKLTFFDKERYATDDAMRIGRLHTFSDGWEDANLDYMLSGGFSPSLKVSKLQTETLVLWGKQDKILDPAQFAERFLQEMPNCQLEWISDCGHMPHLEQPKITAEKLVYFCSNRNTLKADVENTHLCAKNESQG